MIALRTPCLWALMPVILTVPACSDAMSPPPPPPPATLPRIIGDRVLPDRHEIDIRFEGGEGAPLEGTLYLPVDAAPRRTFVLQSGSSWTTRESWAEVSFLVSGLPFPSAVFAYDRRSHGESGGSCCPVSEDALYDLLARDLAGAVDAITIVEQVDPAEIGLLASSQGGWTAPVAADLAGDGIRFLIVVVGGAISTGQEALYDELTGYSVCERTATSIEEITQALRDAGPSGFDPRPSLEALAQPALWIYGGKDWSHPAGFSTEKLLEVSAIVPKDWTIVTLPDANHELIDGGEICETGAPTADVLTPIATFLDGLP